MNPVNKKSLLLQTLEALTKGLTTVKEAVYLLKSATDQLPPGDTQQAIHEKIEEAERAIQLGHAEMGESLGFQLCHCTWPAQVMASTRYTKETQVEQFTCPNCKKSLSLSGRKNPSERITAFDPYDVY
ncbi:MAG: hypothetical protein WD425_14730 [Nitrospirales bacterium]